MKIRLLEKVRMPGVSGDRGEVVDVEASLAESLERHGQAAYLARERKRPEPPVEQTTDHETSTDEEESEDREKGKKGKGKR